MRNVLALAFVVGTLAACGGGNKGTTAPSGGGGSEGTPKVIIEDSSETWYEQESGKAGEKGTGVREFHLDVTKRVEWKGGGGTMVDAGPPPPDKIFRIFVRYPVPKVTPADARDVHAINRLLWEVRSEIAKCYYKGPGKEPGEETSMVGWLDVDKNGDVKGGGVEKSDEAMKKTGADECILENVKGLKFSAAGDETKVRFKLKLQTSDWTGQPDAKVAPK